MGQELAEEGTVPCSTVDLSAQTPKKKKAKKPRCSKCAKKVTLAGGVECRCGHLFCSGCRYPEEHNCTFDWRSHDREGLNESGVLGGGSFAKVEKL
jgi:hypothetical protein